MGCRAVRLGGVLAAAAAGLLRLGGRSAVGETRRAGSPEAKLVLNKILQRA